MFVVVYRGEKTELFRWKPTDKSQYEVSESTARDRFRCLVQSGQARTPVDGIVPWFVGILDANQPAPEAGTDSILKMKDTRFVLTAFVDNLDDLDDLDGQSVGPWANLAAAN